MGSTITGPVRGFGLMTHPYNGSFIEEQAQQNLCLEFVILTLDLHKCWEVTGWGDRVGKEIQEMRE